MDSCRADGNGLVQHGWPGRRLVWRRLFQSLALLLLAVSAVLLLFDVDLLFTCSFAVIGWRRLAGGLGDAREWEAGWAFWAMDLRWRLSRGGLTEAR